MSPVGKDIVRKKLEIIIENLKALEQVKDIAFEEYTVDFFTRKATERMLQELIEAAIDINTHIIVESGNAVPDSYYESFIKLGEMRVLPADLAEKLAPSAGLRNRLVHEYDVLEHSMVLDAVGMAEDLYAEYIREIDDYISKWS